MRANFKKLRVEVAFDEFKELDIARQLGNFIHANTPDIGMDDIAREIYYSQGDVEIPEDYAEGIVSMIKSAHCNFLACVKKAVINELEESGDGADQ